jgi:Holliday junction resolvasome RuvABC DNA-binding subunit
MLDYIELNNTNHFFDGEWLYIKVKDNVYRFLLKSYKDLKRTNKAYVLSYYDHDNECHLAFYNKNVRNLYEMLLKVNFLSWKTIELIIKEFNVDEFYELVKKLDYEKLTTIKGIGIVTSKAIIDKLKKEIFQLKLNTNDEEIISSLIKMGFSKKQILSKWATINNDLSTKEFVKQLIQILDQEKTNLNK